MARSLWLPLALALTLVLAASAAAGDNLGQQKASVDAQLASVQAQLAQSRQRAAALTGQISSLTKSIQGLERKVGDVSTQLSALQTDIALHQRRLAKLDELYRVQTARLRALRRQYTLAVQRLDARLVSIYKEPAPSTLDLVVAAKSFQDVLDQMDYLGAIANQDKRIATEVAIAKKDVAAALARTRTMRRTVQQETQVISGRAQQVAILRVNLLGSQNRLAGARGKKANALAATRRTMQQEVAESQALQAAQATIEAKLRAAASGGTGTATDSTGGSSAPAAPGTAPRFAWPVSGPITSPFGMRWGSLHPGIDIGVPLGTPVHAAAAGKVVWCGWMSGYGNFVLIDHGGGYATGYGHNTSVAVSCGQEVAQGQVIAYSGCTGFCTGPHVHFEVRVNGTPVDPLGYLGG